MLAAKGHAGSRAVLLGNPNCRTHRWRTPKEKRVAKFITVGYGDEAGYRRIDGDVRAAAHAHDARLKADGALIGIAQTPVQVRNPAGTGVQTRSGAYLRSDLPIAGFAVIEAKNLDDAIALVSKTPCAVAYGVVEVWPLQEPA